MSLPFSHRKSLPGDASHVSRGPPGTSTSTARLSTSHSSNRPISTSSRGYSIASNKNSLPEKQLLSRYRHVYAGKGGWFQGRSGNTQHANYTSGTNSRHLDVYRKELIMKLSKDIFENSKQKLTTADYVVSNKVAGDPDPGDVHNVTTKLGENATKQITHVEVDTPRASPTPLQREHRREPEIASRQKTNVKQPIKPVFHSLKSSSHPVRDQSAAVNKAPIKINLRGGSSKVEKSVVQRLNATTAAGYKPSTAKPGLAGDSPLVSAREVTLKHEATQNTRPENINTNTSTVNSMTMNNRSSQNQNDVLGLKESQGQVNIDKTNEPAVNKANKSTSRGEVQPAADHNEFDDSYLFAALKKRSNTIHIGSPLKTRHAAKELNTVSSLHIKETQIATDNPDKSEAAERSGINNTEPQNTVIESKKNAVDRQSQYLAKAGESVEKTDGQKHESTTKSGSKQNKRSVENNPAEKSSKHKKSGKRDKSLEENVVDILGEIQFNVLRQRSFIRMPKSVSKALENERPTTRGENGLTRQILSRMSLSKEAQDALQETRQEMHRESVVNLDKFDISKLQAVVAANTNKRPNSPKPESTVDSTTNATQSSARGSSSVASNPRPKGKHNKSARKTVKGKDVTDSVKSPQETKKFTIPQIEYTVDSSRDKFNHSIEQGISAKKPNASRASTVATPITDLVSALPTKQQQEGYVRYSTNMSRDTPRGGGGGAGNSNRVASNRNRKTTSGAAPATTRTSQQLTVPIDSVRNGGLTAGGGGGGKKLKHSYNVPLKASTDDMHGGKGGGGGGGGPINNGLPNDDESIKSDWESQLRAMSKYGLVTEKSFQITPPGWDERYKDLMKKNAGKEEKEPETTLAEVKDKAVEKCSDWLQKYV